MKCEKTHQFFSMYGGLLTRIVVGLIFVLAGYGKLFGTPGIDGFTGMLEGMGFPIPGILAILVGIVELVGGLFLIIGLFTKGVSKLLAIIMLVAILTVHLGSWNEVKYPLLLFVLLLGYIGHPAGLCSIGGHKKRKHHKVAEPAKPTARKPAAKKKTAKKTTKKKVAKKKVAKKKR